MRAVTRGSCFVVGLWVALAGSAAADVGDGTFRLASWLPSPREPSPGRPDASSPFKAPPPAVSANPWSVGIRSGYTTIPNAVIGAFFEKYKPINGWFLEGVVGRKIRGFTLYTSLTVTGASSDPGEWQRAGKIAERTAVDFFVLSAEALVDWEVRLHPRFAFHFGAGLGLGGAIGNITSQQCAPGVVMGMLVSCVPDQNAAIKDKLGDGWPIYPILHLVAGTRINIIEKLALTIDFDFRNAFGVGFGVFYTL